MASTSNTVSIYVQPPSQTTVNTLFCVVAQARINDVRADQGCANVFATAILLDGHGNGGGITVATGETVADGNSAGSSLYFSFPNLFASHSGTYTIRIHIFLMSLPEKTCSLLCQAKTRAFAVYGDSVAIERPC
ncbi:hypothetical protein QBC46DRAFT_318051 [Diplogelasinospora grovesii]|uniref:Velvet domain-containing protein n=1 Tax=Diplogelasinospora grovesii TaxID=303347 RepID=A0AAN6S363_9PEZI|nr:hypothetical protein QBC46DRAFT_318051 [Diplogelasinospora grovesii]